MNRFRIKTQVLPEHIDNLGHVNNVQYLHWVQTVAEIQRRDAVRKLH
jgi:acyl-CoA thioesterase FadM